MSACIVVYIAVYQWLTVTHTYTQRDRERERGRGGGSEFGKLPACDASAPL